MKTPVLDYSIRILKKQALLPVSFVFLHFAFRSYCAVHIVIKNVTNKRIGFPFFA